MEQHSALRKDTHCELRDFPPPTAGQGQFLSPQGRPQKGKISTHKPLHSLLLLLFCLNYKADNCPQREKVKQATEGMWPNSILREMFKNWTDLSIA